MKLLLLMVALVFVAPSGSAQGAEAMGKNIANPDQLSWPVIANPDALIALARADIARWGEQGGTAIDWRAPGHEALGSLPVFASFVTKDALVVVLDTEAMSGQAIVVAPDPARLSSLPPFIVRMANTAVPEIKQALLALNSPGGVTPSSGWSIRIFEVRNRDAARAGSPRHLEMSLPDYPWDMQRAGIPGEVRVNFVVTRSGTVTNAEIKASSGEFAPPVQEALARWRFKPGVDLETRLPVDVRMSAVIRFDLPDD